MQGNKEFAETLDVKHKTAVCRFGASKENCKETKEGNILCSNIAKCCGHRK